MKGFWAKLKRPIFVLAPMEDVTDSVFRRIVARAGRPDVFFTEFTNVEGMDSEGVSEVAKRLKFTDEERPIVAQVWGLEPDKFYKAAVKIREMGFDGIDINFGCPVRDVIKRGACSAMIDPKFRPQVSEILRAVIEGAGELPVSVKTRIGVKSVMTEDWVGFLLEMNLAAITVHGRTAVQMSEGQADWGEIGKAVKLRDQLKARTLIIGNGDIDSRKTAFERCEEYGVDGVMVGRGIFKDVWMFNEQNQAIPLRTVGERLGLLRAHIDLWRETWGGDKNFSVLKKYIKIYVSGFEGAGELRERLMSTKSLDELKATCIESFTQA